MWKKLRPFVLAFSIALNVTLLGTWMLHALPAHLHEWTGNDEKQPLIWSSLHRELGVTDEQWEKIEPDMRRFQQKIRDQRSKMRELRVEMLEILRQPEVDQERLEEHQNTMQEAHREMQEMVLSHILTQKRLLTNTQKERLFQILDRRMNSADHRGPLMGEGQTRGASGCLPEVNKGDPAR